ncbi:hypothetical protein MOQ_000476 [Trypanosoma cruzi marinkellei]|uniref:RRM domain-containing protein n=1 Tax=Trypanosoma cruzi marinkellei TaxID=85056 RepID=K2NW76_TRYCR|nr:hypothetical protein MOQ_000476 [Trypanosoma cruzi marinkellei]
MRQRVHGCGMGPVGGERGGVPDAAAKSPASFSSSSCAPHSEPPKLHLPQLSQDSGLSLTRTIFIKNVPPTVDNSHKLLPFVPSAGLVALRVKRAGGRDVGFAEYNTADSAYRALQWFYRLEVTAGIAFNCFPRMLQKWTPIPPRFRYPVPYDEYNHCAGDPTRSTELLLNSVILIAEWSVSTPTCRPGSDSSVTSPQPLSHQYYHFFAQKPIEFIPQATLQLPSFVFQPSPVGHCAGFTPVTTMPQWGNGPVIPSNIIYFKPSVDPIAVGSTNGCSGSVAGCPMKSKGNMQRTASCGNYLRAFKNRNLECQLDTVTSPLHFKSQLSHNNKASKRGVLDPTIASALLDDNDLPSSTLFVRVMSPFERRRRELILSLTSMGSSFLKETGNIGEASETTEVSSCLQNQEKLEKQYQQEMRQVKYSSEEWSCFHHRHHLCTERKLSEEPLTPYTADATTMKAAALPDFSDNEEPMCNELLFDEVPRLPPLLFPIADCEDSDMGKALVKMLLKRNFFSERFAGFYSYVPYSKWAGFARFETSGDARRCLLWLRRNPDLAPLINVQFAREDTRRYRSHMARMKGVCH